MTTFDEFIWQPDALARLCTHERKDIRQWALRRIEYGKFNGVLDAAIDRLDDPDDDVAFSAIHAVEALRVGCVSPEKIDLSSTRERLWTLLQRDLPLGILRGALSLFAHSGDPRALDLLESKCVGLGAYAYWALLIEHAPSRAWSLVQRGSPRAQKDKKGKNRLGTKPSEQMQENDWVLAFIDLAPPAEAPVVLRHIESGGESEERLAEQVLFRCGAEFFCMGNSDRSLLDLRALIDELQQVYRDSAEGLRWLKDASLESMLGAIERGAWSDVVRDCASRIAAAPMDDEPGQWTGALVSALATRKHPTALHGFIACALALAQSHRALLDQLTGDQAPLEALYVHACFASECVAKPLAARVIAMWNSLASTDPQRAQISAQLELILPRNMDHGTRMAFELAAKLPGLELPWSVYHFDTDELSEATRLSHEHCVNSQPESLRATLGRALDECDEFQLVTVFGGLERVGKRWATALCLQHFEKLFTKNDAEHAHVLFAELGDPTVLSALLERWRPNEIELAVCIDQIATINGVEDTLPPGLTAEAAAERARLDALTTRMRLPMSEQMALNKAEPLVRLNLRCNRCAWTGTYLMDSVYVEPDRNKCEREGWDGYVMGDIVVCKFCRAEDDYTLSNRSAHLLAIRTLRLLGVFSQTQRTEDLSDGVVTVARLESVGGLQIRRQSEALRIWTQRTEREPGNVDAWFRCGNVFSKIKRYDEAIECFRRAIALEPGHIEALGSLLSLLMLRRAPFGIQLAQQLFDAFDKFPKQVEERQTMTPTLVAALREILKSGQQLSLVATWPAHELAGRAILKTDAVDLRRVTRWDTLEDFIADSRITGLHIREASPSDVGSILEKLLQSERAHRSSLGATRVIGDGSTPYVRSAPRLGRNDPCHCGSGTKFKKCHGA